MMLSKATAFVDDLALTMPAGGPSFAHCPVALSVLGALDTRDKTLSSGKGPEEIRAGDQLYYIHGKVCPAYGEAGRSYRVYDRELKPSACSDFPVYRDRGGVAADLRCEAVDIAALAAWIARSLGPQFRVVQSADEEFPLLVSLSVKRETGRRD